MKPGFLLETLENGKKERLALVLFTYMSQYIQVNSIRDFSRAKGSCNYISEMVYEKLLPEYGVSALEMVQ